MMALESSPHRRNDYGRLAGRWVLGEEPNCLYEWTGGTNLVDRASQYPTRKIPRVTSPESDAQSGGPRRIDSSSATLPSAYAIPKCLVERADIDWFAPLTARVLALVDGTRTIQQIADDVPMALGEAQLRIADLKERGIIAV
jgi:hypothetical protein